MSNRKPKAGDTVWFRPGKLVDVSEDATGKTLYRVSRPDGLDEFFGGGCIDRFEPAPWKPEPGKQAIECDGKSVWDIVWVGPIWSIVQGPGDELPVLTANLREP